MKKTTTTEDWKLYELGIDYNHSLSPDYYANNNRNERFFVGDHWAGVNSNGLPKPVFNIFKRVINYFIASIMSQAVKMQFNVENISDSTQDETELELKQIAEYLSSHSEIRWEQLKMSDMLRDVLLDAALSGDMASYTFWDDSIDTGQTSGVQPRLDKDGNPELDELGQPILEDVPIMGDFLTEAVDGCNIMFGNVNDKRVNVNGKPKQPYIIIAGREMVSVLREEAKRYRKENGLSPDEINTKIVPDDDNKEQAGDRGSQELNNKDTNYGRATYIIKIWTEKGKVLFNKSVRSAYIRKGADTELTIFPVAWNNWDKRKNSYHGQAVGTGLVDNQIQINAAFAKVFKWMGDMAFGKYIYNSKYINGMTNKIGEIYPVSNLDAGTSISNLIHTVEPTQMSAYVVEVINLAISLTKELIGASDAALGDVDPKNTSAIIVTQKAAAIPLENVKANLYQFVEDIGYIWLDFMLKKYKIPRQIAVDQGGQREMVLLDPSKLQKAKFRIKVDVGPSNYWSELTSAQTLDNMLGKGIIDAIQYLERLPEGYVPMRNELIDELKAQQQQMAEQQAQQQMMEQELAQQQTMMQGDGMNG